MISKCNIKSFSFSKDCNENSKNSFDLLFSILEIFIGIFSTIKINKNKMINAINDSFIQALDLAEFLVSEYGIPFRQSHKIIAKLVRDFKNLQEIHNKENLEKIIFEVNKRRINLPEDLMVSLKNFEIWLEKRKSHGSPSKAQVKKMIKGMNLKKEKLYELYLLSLEKVKNAKDERENIIHKLIL